MTVPRDLARRLEATGQSHLVAHADGLPAGARDAFVAELVTVPWERLAAAWASKTPPQPPDLRPPEALTVRRQRNEQGTVTRLSSLGDALLRGGRVAAALVAGGQGTRLGFVGPKGTFVLGPDPDRSLYAILLERIAATSRRVGKPIPLVVLTSRHTDAATRAHLLERDGFGLPADLVRFVVQGELPALDEQGRALLAEPGRLALSPDGHGGLVEAFHRDGIFDWLASLGVEALATFQVDNPLARPLDPLFLGWMLDRHAPAAGKAIRKRDPAEKVGVFARGLDGRVRIVEYSELPPDGAPDLVLGSIAVHAFSVEWIRRLLADPAFSLPWHRAHKRVSCLGPDGCVDVAGEPNAWKLEQFLFDLLPLSPRVAIVEVDRAREFAAVKNADGLNAADCPASTRAAVAAEIARWHREAGIPVPDPIPSLRPLVFDGPEDLAPAR